MSSEIVQKTSDFSYRKNFFNLSKAWKFSEALFFLRLHTLQEFSEISYEKILFFESECFDVHLWVWWAPIFKVFTSVHLSEKGCHFSPFAKWDVPLFLLFKRSFHRYPFELVQFLRLLRSFQRLILCCWRECFKKYMLYVNIKGTSCWNVIGKSRKTQVFWIGSLFLYWCLKKLFFYQMEVL